MSWSIPEFQINFTKAAGSIFFNETDKNIETSGSEVDILYWFQEWNDVNLKWEKEDYANIEDIKYRMKKAMPYKEHIDEGQNAAAGAFNEEIGELLDPEGTQAEAESFNEDEPDLFLWY